MHDGHIFFSCYNFVENIINTIFYTYYLLIIFIATTCCQEGDFVVDSITDLHLISVFTTILQNVNRSLVSEHKFTPLFGRSVGRSFLPWVVNFCYC